MTEQELKEKIKEKFNSVCEKIFRLEIKYSDNLDVMAALSVISFTVGAVLAEANIQPTQDDQKYPHLLRTLNSHSNGTQPMAPKLKPMSLQECYNFMEKADSSLDIEDKILELADHIKGEQNA